MRGVIFDLDGTLIDSIPDVVGSLNAVLRSAGRREISVAEGRLMVGGGAEPLLDRAFRATGDPANGAEIGAGVAAFLEEYKSRPALETTIYPGAEAALDELASAGYALGICTNKPHQMALTVLDALNLTDRFACSIGKGAFDYHKPDRRHYDAVATGMGIEARETVYIGDSSTDVETARAANVPVVVVTFGYNAAPVETLGADRLIDSFSELSAAIGSITEATLPQPSGGGR